jgi:hypothetical protein
LAGPANATAVNLSPSPSFVTGINSYAGSGTSETIENYDGTPVNADVIVSPRTTPGISTWTVKEGVPNNMSANDADLYLNFKLANSLPIYSVITITIPFSLVLAAST